MGSLCPPFLTFRPVCHPFFSANLPFPWIHYQFGSNLRLFFAGLLTVCIFMMNPHPASLLANLQNYKVKERRFLLLSENDTSLGEVSNTLYPNDIPPKKLTHFNIHFNAFKLLLSLLFILFFPQLLPLGTFDSLRKISQRAASISQTTEYPLFICF